MIYKTLSILLTLFVLCACSQDKKSKSTSGMKCGAGKCGANMFDGNSGLDKYKKSFLSQMQKDDARKSCVMQANSVKEVYDCVRDKTAQRLKLQGSDASTTKRNEVMKCGGAMQCGAGKCG